MGLTAPRPSQAQAQSASTATATLTLGALDPCAKTATRSRPSCRAPSCTTTRALGSQARTASWSVAHVTLGAFMEVCLEIVSSVTPTPSSPPRAVRVITLPTALRLSITAKTATPPPSSNAPAQALAVVRSARQGACEDERSYASAQLERHLECWLRRYLRAPVAHRFTNSRPSL